MVVAPHIRDLNLNSWHEVPKGATIPAGTRYFCVFPDSTGGISTAVYDYPAADRNPDNRFFTAEPIPDPRETEVEAEAKRMFDAAYPGWQSVPESIRDDFRSLAVGVLDRQKKES